MNDKIVIYKRFYNPMEANMIKGILEAHGYPSFLSDENSITVNPFYNQALGGIKLNVFEKDIEDINKILESENREIIE
ncbi:MAG: DUF2007 domain-containing protein [Bacteroidia bacterium]|nr:DUF2007 domain-containing protein [Bacteroidia bacterium]